MAIDELICKDCAYFKTDDCEHFKEEGEHPAEDDWCFQFKVKEDE
jgi:hypothetical protein